MSDPSEILKRRLQAIIDGEEPARGLHFFCQVGGTYHDYGMRTLQVSGQGHVLLGWREGDGERQLYSVQLLERDWKRFYQMLLDLPFWEKSPARRTRRDDDELNIHLRLSDQGAGTWNGLQFWAEDMKDFRVLRDLMYRLDRFSSAVSQGDIPKPDWRGVLEEE